MVNYLGAINRPFSDWKKLLIGAVIYMIPYLQIVTSLFANGYVLVAAKGAISREKKLPEWTDWAELFVKGLLAAVIWAIYMIPVGILALIFGMAKPMINMMMGRGMALAFSPNLLIIALVAIALAYIAPYAILLYIDRDSFREAFRLEEVFTRTFTPIYFKAWIIGVFYSVILGLIISSLNNLFSFTVVLPVALNGLYKITAGLTIMTLLGEAFRELK